MPVDPDSPISRSAGAEFQAALASVPDGIVVTVQRAGFIRGGEAIRRAGAIVARTRVGGE